MCLTWNWFWDSSLLVWLAKMAESNPENRFVRRLNFTSSNLAADWKVFKAQFEVYKVAKKIAGMDTEEEKIANLMLLMGPECVPIFEQFTFHATEEGRTKTLTNVVAMFDGHFEPAKNVIFERVKFNSLRQGGRPVHQFITELQRQAGYCEYGEMKDDLVRDRIVVGVDDSKLREYLIDLDELTLAKCIQKSKQYVSHHEQAAKLDSWNEDSVESLSSQRKSQVPTRRGESGRSVGQDAVSKCFFCGRGHQGLCPARKSTCHICKRTGHWAGSRACKAKKRHMAHAVTEEECGDMLDGLFLGDDS